MHSAFGIDHGEISKSLKPRHLAALKRVESDRSLGNWKNQSYAHNRVELHSISDTAGSPGVAQRMTISRGMYKKPLGRLTRTKRSTRDKNRKAVFGETSDA